MQVVDACARVCVCVRVCIKAERHQMHITWYIRSQVAGDSDYK